MQHEAACIMVSICNFRLMVAPIQSMVEVVTVGLENLPSKAAYSLAGTTLNESMGSRSPGFSWGTCLKPQNK